ncbi:hypothetical protein [Streptomyces sp. CB02115]|uniref:hypothetical protein n=1 Tax=Streptomyces sp. CB02115 TaxID=1703939 RepID=UPI0018E9624D|nr:hypothetical protein [Streptomyces sp. CB02115]
MLKHKVLNIFPSVDTPAYATSVRKSGGRGTAHVEVRLYGGQHGDGQQCVGLSNERILPSGRHA